MLIRDVRPEDFPKLTELYNYYITDTFYTMETEPLTVEAFTARANKICEKYPYVVCEEEGELLGFAYLHYYNDRGGYRYTVENSIYVSRLTRHKGIGRALMQELITRARKAGYRMLVSMVVDKNKASIAFHESLGLRKAGHLENICTKLGETFGICYFQMELPPLEKEQ